MRMLLSSLLAAQLAPAPVAPDGPAGGSDAPAARPSISDGAHGGADGFFFVRIEDDGTAGPLFEATEKLQALPQVVLANPELLSPGCESYRRPNDGSGFDDWSLSARDASGDNWGLERIAAPLGWGCSVGDRQTGIAVIDRDFHAISELTDTLDSGLGLGAFTGGTDHRTLVLSVLVARGNDSTTRISCVYRSEEWVVAKGRHGGAAQFVPVAGVVPAPFADRPC